MHYQIENVQDKLIRVVRGTIYDVAVDLRKSSPNFGKWAGVTISARNKSSFVPKGFAHGFIVTSKEAEVLYKTTSFYNPSAERCLNGIVLASISNGLSFPHSMNVMPMPLALMIVSVLNDHPCNWFLRSIR